MTKTKTEILRENYEYYTTDPNRRGVNVNGGSEYLSNDGKCCIVGRGMIDPPMQDSISSIFYIRDLVEALGGDIDDLLKPEYRGHTLSFWVNLQLWHDNVDYWDEDGLTQAGQESFDALVVRFGDE